MPIACRVCVCGETKPSALPDSTPCPVQGTTDLHLPPAYKTDFRPQRSWSPPPGQLQLGWRRRVRLRHDEVHDNARAHDHDDDDDDDDDHRCPNRGACSVSHVVPDASAHAAPVPRRLAPVRQDRRWHLLLWRWFEPLLSGPAVARLRCRAQPRRVAPRAVPRRLRPRRPLPNGIQVPPPERPRCHPRVRRHSRGGHGLLRDVVRLWLQDGLLAGLGA